MQTTKEQVQRLQEENALRREMHKRQRELEFARTSKPVSVDDDQGTTWVYVIVDESVARIVSMQSEQRTIEIPSELGGYRVYALAPDACSRNDFVEEFICPDNIESIGACAFRFCKSLKRIVFPKGIAEYNASWLSHCPNLEEVVLPGLLETLDSSIFDNEFIKKLVIGKSARLIKPGAFQKTHLEEVIIDEENPYIRSDGDAIYSVDGTIFLALVRPVERVTVREGCSSIAKKALYGIESLKHAELPESIRIIGEFAFSHSALEEFAAPPETIEIQQKAFLACGNLEQVSLNEGIKVIGDSAFEQSAITELFIPRTIESIGASITKGTRVVHCGKGRTFKIDERCETLFTDGEGGLYRHEEDGVHLIQLIDSTLTAYDVFEGTRVIDDHAFAFNGVIEHVSIPEGVRVIEPSAFRVCRNLVRVDIADSVEEIGEEAFFDTSLEEFRIPASLESLGKRALVTYGAHHGDQRPSLGRITIAPGNDRFVMVDGILCRRKGDGLSAVVFTNSQRDVVFPENLVNIEDYAFNNAKDIEHLTINKALKTIGTAGLTTWCWIKHIHVDMAEPIEGRSEIDLFFPNTPKSLHGISLGIGGASWVNVPGLIAQYDICVVNAHDYTRLGDYESISIYDQVKLVIGRLKDPFLLTEVNRGIYERLVRNHLVEMCVDIARHDDRPAVDDLVELGFLDRNNIEDVISRVGRLQDAAMSGYLLELKRRQFGMAAFDFDL